MTAETFLKHSRSLYAVCHIRNYQNKISQSVWRQEKSKVRKKGKFENPCPQSWDIYGLSAAQNQFPNMTSLAECLILTYHVPKMRGATLCHRSASNYLGCEPWALNRRLQTHYSLDCFVQEPWGANVDMLFILRNLVMTRRFK